jgi:sugar lactone lactonase YvrE
MNTRLAGFASVFTLFLLLITSSFSTTNAETVPFDTTYWDLSRAEVVDHLDRQALKGGAALKDVEFLNGILEVDVAFTGARSYPGFRFRMQDSFDWEEVYVRPHRMGLYEDVIQYTPAFSGISCWQLYCGSGEVAPANPPENEWVHLKVEVKDSQAYVYVGDSDEPALYVPSMVHDPVTGGIALNGPADGSAFFSNFSYTITDDLEFPDPAPTFAKPGLVTDWEITQAVQFKLVDKEKHHTEQDIMLEWKPVVADRDGMVNLSRYAPAGFRGAATVWAKATIDADEAGRHKYNLAYSDWVSVFLNGELVFQGHSAYRERDSSFKGDMGFFDALYLPLNRGENTIELMISEGLGGSGFALQAAETAYMADGAQKIWETGRVFGLPESVAFDATNQCLYVSNYYDGGNEYLSKLSLDGTVIEQKFVEGLRLPAGVAVYDRFVWAATANGLVSIDPDTREIVDTIPMPEGGTMNDVGFDGDGNAYVSDSRNDRIFKYDGQELITWFEGSPLNSPNGVLAVGADLWVGNFNDGALVALSLQDASLKRTIQLPLDAQLDGLALDAQGRMIVSGYEGRVFRVDLADESIELLVDLTVLGVEVADLTTIPEQNLILIPSYADNRVVALQIDE